MTDHLLAKNYDLTDSEHVTQLMDARLDYAANILLKTMESDGVEGSLFALLGTVLGIHIALDIELQEIRKRLDALEG